MILLRVFLVAAWLMCLGTTIVGALGPGFPELMPTYVAGFASPWGAAMNVDFALYLAAASIWIVWSARTMPRGLVYGLLAFVFGGSFTFAYVLAQTFLLGGDVRAVLLGRQQAI